MLHLIFCLRRLPHLSRDEFQRYWRERHAPVVRAHAAALGIRRYVQAHTVDHPVAEAALALLEDERRFLDLARSPIFFAEDYVVVG